MNTDLKKLCSCAINGTYCQEGLQLAVNASRLAHRAEMSRGIEEQNAFVDAYRAIQWHIHDARAVLEAVEKEGQAGER